MIDSDQPGGGFDFKMVGTHVYHPGGVKSAEGLFKKNMYIEIVL